MTRSGFVRALGPGVLFTGAAVGVSHLVQSTRAGAGYGFALVVVVILANLAKYPAFRFGPEYAAITGTSLLEGYRQQGGWALGLYALLTAGTMFTVLAAVTLLTAGLAIHVLGLPGDPVLVSGAILVVCAALVGVGYRVLDIVSKVVVTVLSVSTVVAAAVALPAIDWSAMTLWISPADLGPADIAFIVALVGWMPSAIDVSVWQSLWTLARAESTGHRPRREEALFDFHLGYVGTALLALCFVVLGAAVLQDAGPLEEAPAKFAEQLLGLYGTTLGAWATPILAVCALATMFSTTLTVLDGFPRAISVLVARFAGPETPVETQPVAARAATRRTRVVFWVTLVVLGAGALLIIQALLGSLRALVDVATTLSFLTAPLLAWLNHRAMMSSAVPLSSRPRRWLVFASWAGILALSALACYYLALVL
jgi:Mn2+/Fe2+ NRAMP family transporter